MSCIELAGVCVCVVQVHLIATSVRITTTKTYQCLQIKLSTINTYGRILTFIYLFVWVYLHTVGHMVCVR